MTTHPEIRKAYEELLKTEMQNAFGHYKNFRISKNTITIKSDTNKTFKVSESNLHFEYAHKGWNLGLLVESPVIYNFIQQLNTPYLRATPWVMYYYSLAVKNNYFVPFENLGTIGLPPNLEEVPDGVGYIIERLQEVFIPKILNFIDIKPELIDDILFRPEDYYYPIPIVIYTLKHNGLPLTVELKSTLLSDKYIKNLEFDKNLLDSFKQINPNPKHPQCQPTP